MFTQWLKTRLPEKLRHLSGLLGLDQKRCANCGAPFFAVSLRPPPHSQALCCACQEQLQPYTGPRCHLCGLPTISRTSWLVSPKTGICRQCANEPPPWDHVAMHGIYEGELRDLLLRLKFDGEISIARLLGEFLCNASCCLPRPDALAAIPQHPAHLRHRGYNQAYELARELGRLSGLPLRSDLLQRVERSLPQEGLTASQRRANLRGAFRASTKAQGLYIWLIDDIVTTGSTCRAAALELKAAGAYGVSLLFVARTGIS